MSKQTLRERLAAKREGLKRQGPGKFLTIKEGTTRIRVLPVGEEKDWAMEVVYFYLGVSGNMGVISPKTFDEKCAIMKANTQLTASKKTEDRELAKKFKPQRKWLVAVIKYKDEKGKEIDTELGVKLLLISGGIYQDMLDLYLDDDSGDFTDPKTGYDLKIKRTGKGKNDTEYTVLRANPSKLDSAFRKEVNIEKMVKEITPTYEETKEIINQYFQLPPAEDDEDDNKGKKDKKKKKKRNKDL
jgi:hypothetical protein